MDSAEDGPPAPETLRRVRRDKGENEPTAYPVVPATGCKAHAFEITLAIPSGKR